MNRVSLVITLGAALGGACSDPTSTAPTQLNLDRPVDIAFACHGGMRVTNGSTTATAADPIVPTAQPAISCDTRSLPYDFPYDDVKKTKPTCGLHPPPPPMGQEPPPPLPECRPPGQEELPNGAPAVGPASWFGFILQSAAGTVAIAQWPSKSADDFLGGDVVVLDADPLTPGKNAISVGEDPIAIATDKTGCYEITANAGSCDLSALDINSALDSDPETTVNRLSVMTAKGPMLARPAAMVAEPNTEVVGNTCAATPSGLVYIAYPSCHLVAAVETSTGMIKGGIQYTATGPTVLDAAGLAALSCPAECTHDKDALGTITAGTRPVTLALELDPRVKTKRLVIGADNSASFAIVELGPDSLPLSMSQIALQDPSGKLGITSIALSPQLGLGGLAGVVNDDDPNQAQYVYAVATDNTVRVADVLTLNRECDTQVDSRFVRSIRNVSALQCFPLNDPATPRRVGAGGPGIQVGGVPTSVAFVKAPSIEGDTRGVVPTALVGTFAIITTASGGSFVVNVDDDNNVNVGASGDLFQPSAPQLTAPPLIMAHQLRDNVEDRGALTATDPNMENSNQHSCLDPGANPDLAGGNSGGPRATTAPARNVTGGPVADSKVIELPILRQVKCTGYDATTGIPVSEVQFAADPVTRDQEFPDLASLSSDENWSMTYEGTLSQDTNLTSVDGPPVRSGTMTVDPTNGSMHLKDQTQPFCSMGVELFDIVQFRGCNPANGDGDCPAAYQCYVHPDSQVAIGACMLRSEASRLATACRDFLTSLRRYTVGLAKSGELVLLPRKHELRTTPVDGCTSDAQCEALADYALQNGSRTDPVLDQTRPDPHTWACQADDARAPINADPAQNKRCVETCASNVDCDLGTICQGASAGKPGVCLEGVTPPQSCVNGPQRFDVRASEAFTVIGSRHGYIHPIVEQGGPNGQCVRATGAPSQVLGRIPLKAPACDPTADPITGKLPGGGFEANPCSLTVSEFENKPNYPDLAKDTKDSCKLGTPQVIPTARADAPAIQFRNPAMKLTIVDPTYPGDKTCILDRQGTLGQIPLVFPGYQLSFHQTAGYTPLALPISPAFPVKVVRGPTNSIWVIDDGDFLSTSVTQASTRGKVYRVESSHLNAVNLLQ